MWSRETLGESSANLAKPCLPLDSAFSSNPINQSQQGSNAISQSQQGSDAISQSQQGSDAISQSQQGSDAISQSQQGSDAISQSQQGSDQPEPGRTFGQSDFQHFMQVLVWSVAWKAQLVEAEIWQVALFLLIPVNRARQRIRPAATINFNINLRSKQRQQVLFFDFRVRATTSPVCGNA